MIDVSLFPIREEDGYFALQLWIERSGPSPGQGHCVVFLGKTLKSHSASLHPGVQMSNAGGNPAME